MTEYSFDDQNTQLCYININEGLSNDRRFNVICVIPHDLSRRKILFQDWPKI